MRTLRFVVSSSLLYVGLVYLLFGGIEIFAQSSQANTPSSQADASAGTQTSTVIKAESRLVLVDTIVTDKHGKYIRDLSQKDFKIWEDGKEQVITTFSYEADPNSPRSNQKHYMVLFFDNSSMETADQITARKAAASFIDANAGPNRYMAILNYGGTVKVSQNFTTDAARLKQIATGTKIPSISNPGEAVPADVASLGAPPLLYASEADYSTRTMLLALRSVAKGLVNIEGRKSLILLTAGFPWTSEAQSELTAVISACNKANVAVYPVDVRGLAPSVAAPVSTGELKPERRSDQPWLVYASMEMFEPQHAGGGGTTSGGGHGPGGGTTGTANPGRGGTTTTGPVRGTTAPTMNTPNPIFNQPRQIVPTFPPSATINQQVLYELAEGTGGFVIVNTNDLAGGMGKIASEQLEYYTLGYVPTASAENSCHTLKVKVDRDGSSVRSRSGYCNVKPVDMLAGKSAAKDLENRAAGAQPGDVQAFMLAPYFFSSPNVARIDLSMEVPSNSIKFEKVNGKQHATINVLGIAKKSDGSVAGRFSDAVELNFDSKDELKEFMKKPYHYENQFELAPGEYKLTVVFSSGGESFGKIEAPLAIDKYDGKEFTLSSVALSKEMHRHGEGDTSLDSELLEDRKPLVTQGMEMIPAADSHFKKSDPAAVYVEAYDPLLAGPNPPKIGLEIKVVDRKTGETKVDAAVKDASGSVTAGSPVVPMGLRIPTDRLPPGSYRIDMIAYDSAGNRTKASSANFDLE